MRTPKAKGEKQLVNRIIKDERLQLQQNRDNIANVDRLRDLEDIIERGMEIYLQMGYALMEIRDQKLWKPFYASFDDYCLERWKFGAKQGYHLIRAVNTSKAMGRYPKNEAIAREFAKLAEDDPEKAREVFDALCSINPGHTALEARAFIRDPKPARPPQPQDDLMRRTKSHFDGMLAKFEDDHTRRQQFIWDLLAYMQSQLYFSMSEQFANNSSYQREQAEMMICSDDPELVERGKRKKAKLLAGATE